MLPIKFSGKIRISWHGRFMSAGQNMVRFSKLNVFLRILCERKIRKSKILYKTNDCQFSGKGVTFENSKLQLYPSLGIL